MLPPGIDIYNFIAIDFETAVGKEACQLGIAVVEDLRITDKRCLLIKPPGNEYNWHNIKVHGIKPEMTKNAPTFAEVWPQVAHLFERAIVVAHNAPFDLSVLSHALETYNLTPPNITAVVDTCALSNKMKLDDLCKRLHVRLDNHHDALCDAVACAEIIIKMNHVGGWLGSRQEDNDDDICEDEEFNQAVDKWIDDNLEELLGIFKSKVFGEAEDEPRPKNVQKGRHPGLTRHDFAKFEERRINVDCSELEHDEEGAFAGMNVVITGVFNQSRDEIIARAYEQGATILKNITKKMNCIIVGDDPGPAKMEKLADLLCNGANITVYHQEDVDRLLFPEE